MADHDADRFGDTRRRSVPNRAACARRGHCSPGIGARAPFADFPEQGRRGLRDRVEVEAGPVLDTKARLQPTRAVEIEHEVGRADAVANDVGNAGHEGAAVA